jgi:hypothetical protein
VDRKKRALRRKCSGFFGQTLCPRPEAGMHFAETRCGDIVHPRHPFMKETVMSQETEAAQDAQSEAHVDISTKEGLARWTKALSVTGEALESAVKAVGTRVDKIKTYLTTGLAGKQEAG